MSSKKILSLIIVLIMSVFLFVGCISNKTDVENEKKESPEKTVSKIMYSVIDEYIQTGKLNAAKEYCVDGDTRIIELYICLFTGGDIDKTKYNVSEIVVNGDEATAVVDYDCESKTNDKAVKGGTVKFYLKKIDEIWKIYDAEYINIYV